MTEKLGIDGAFGNGSAVDSYIFRMLPGAVGVDDLREEFFARATFSYHEHRQIDRSHTDGSGYGDLQHRRIADYAQALFCLAHISGNLIL